MGNIFSEIPPPSHWQDFERLTLDMFKIKWRDDYAERNGRDGQSQSGVDVFGYNRENNEATGVQCKKRRNRLNAITAPSSSLTTSEIDAEIALAESFRPRLDRFIIATTGPRDTGLQHHIREYNSNNHSIKISIFFWEDFVEFLNGNENLFYRYYENVLKYRQQYSHNEHYLRMLALAFDRPAIKTPFHLENRATDFIDAISRLQAAIATGILKDKHNHVIDEVGVPSPLSAELRFIKTNLQKIRRIATQAIVNGHIIEHGTVLEIRDPRLQCDLNQLRKEIVDKLNILLGAAQIDIIEIDDY